MLINSIHSIKIIKSLASFLACLLTCSLFSQSSEKQIIRVEKMEYAYHYNIIESINGFAPNYNSRIILAKDDIVAEK
jgi:hypothetical protein